MHRQDVHLTAGRRFGPHHVHRISNLDGRPAVGIHVYAPALQTMTRYRFGAGGLAAAAAAVERAGAQW